MKVLVTGGKGFVGSHLALRMKNLGHHVIVIDDESAEENDEFYEFEGIEYHTKSILDPTTAALYKDVEIVFHAAAKARIQPSVSKPGSAFETNVLGTQMVCEFSRIAGVKRIIYSASSSCYGKANKTPFTEDMKVDCQTPYSLSKWMGEEVCRLYSNLYNLESVILRYFNVYGPREPKKGHYAPVIGLFKRQSSADMPHTVVGSGLQKRDFTYIDDIVEGIIRLLDKKPLINSKWSGLNPEPDSSSAPWSILNIGNNKPTELEHFISIIEKNLGKKAIKNYLGMQPGDVSETAADINKLNQNF